MLRKENTEVFAARSVLNKPFHTVTQRPNNGCWELHWQFAVGRDVEKGNVFLFVQGRHLKILSLLVASPQQFLPKPATNLGGIAGKGSQESAWDRCLMNKCFGGVVGREIGEKCFRLCRADGDFCYHAICESYSRKILAGGVVFWHRVTPNLLVSTNLVNECCEREVRNCWAKCKLNECADTFVVTPLSAFGSSPVQSAEANVTTCFLAD